MRRKKDIKIAKQNKGNGQDAISPALLRFRDHLLKAKMDQESVGFLVGRLMRLVSDAVALEVKVVVGEARVSEIENIKDETEKIITLDHEFMEKKGKSIAQFREEVVEALVQDFESQK